MLLSTVGDDEAYLLERRTEPSTVVVSVDDLLNDMGYASLYYDDSEAELQGLEDAVGDGGDTLVELSLDDQAELDRVEDLRLRLGEQRQSEWAAYGEVFKANVLRAAAELLPNLRVPVDVVVELE
ncbi:MAG: hypothetical protein QOK11_1173 [Pseudonocardiales bacterium]|nr:hypothetical protein [Pseudonocardiales bacterium]